MIAHRSAATLTIVSVPPPESRTVFTGTDRPTRGTAVTKRGFTRPVSTSCGAHAVPTSALTIRSLRTQRSWESSAFSLPVMWAVKGRKLARGLGEGQDRRESRRPSTRPGRTGRLGWPAAQRRRPGWSGAVVLVLPALPPAPPRPSPPGTPAARRCLIIQTARKVSARLHELACMRRTGPPFVFIFDKCSRYVYDENT